MKFVVTGATGFLGWRATTVLRERGHVVTPVARPGAAARAHSRGLDAAGVDAGDPEVRRLLAGCDAVLHFAGVPDPAGAREDPARAVRENAGTTLNLLEGCLSSGCGLVYPSTVRAAGEIAADAYAASKRLGEEACRHHAAAATVVRLTSVFGPGQVMREGATGSIAAFAARALAGEPIVIPGDPRRTRDFLYVDDAVLAIERIATGGRWGESFTLASGIASPLEDTADLVREVAGSSSPIETPGGSLPVGEDASYECAPSAPGLDFQPRPLEAGIHSYVDWLRRHPVAQGGS